MFGDKISFVFVCLWVVLWSLLLIVNDRRGRASDTFGNVALLQENEVAALNAKRVSGSGLVSRTPTGTQRLSNRDNNNIPLALKAAHSSGSYNSAENNSNSQLLVRGATESQLAIGNGTKKRNNNATTINSSSSQNDARNRYDRYFDNTLNNNSGSSYMNGSATYVSYKNKNDREQASSSRGSSGAYKTRIIYSKHGKLMNDGNFSDNTNNNNSSFTFPAGNRSD